MKHNLEKIGIRFIQAAFLMDSSNILKMNTTSLHINKTKHTKRNRALLLHYPKVSGIDTGMEVEYAGN